MNQLAEHIFFIASNVVAVEGKNRNWKNNSRLLTAPAKTVSWCFKNKKKEQDRKAENSTNSLICYKVVETLLLSEPRMTVEGMTSVEAGTAFETGEAYMICECRRMA